MGFAGTGGGAPDESTIGTNANGKLEIKDNGVSAAKLQSNSVTTGKIADANVTYPKLSFGVSQIVFSGSGSGGSPGTLKSFSSGDWAQNDLMEVFLHYYIDNGAGGAWGINLQAGAKTLYSVSGNQQNRANVHLRWADSGTANRGYLMAVHQYQDNATGSAFNGLVGNSYSEANSIFGSAFNLVLNMTGTGSNIHYNIVVLRHRTGVV